jgi:hypothetical protein
MPAILYLVAVTYFGDCISRRFYRFTSIQQRIATAFLVGLLLSGWVVFLSASAFHSLGQPLIGGNIVFVLVLATTVVLSRRFPGRLADEPIARPGGTILWDLVWLIGLLVLATWLMFATLSLKDGQFQIAFKAWTDFGANVSLTQSFALGHNFPPEHPFFPGELIRYHFLFWFQTANLEFLGLNPVWSINLLSIFSLTALLVLIETFGEVLFNSRVAGRLGALLFFFSSSLSYLPFLRSQPSIRGTLSAIFRGTEFLASGYPFRGETWGVLSANVFAYQRHLISGIGLLLVALIFVVDRLRRFKPKRKRDAASDSSDQSDSSPDGSDKASTIRQGFSSLRLGSWIFSGALIGLLPYWNSPTYLAGLAILGCVLILHPVRIGAAGAIAAAIIVGLPQVLMLRSGNVMHYSLFHWGYTLDPPSLFLIVKYLGWTFGVKWILLGVAIVFATGIQRRLLLAISSLVVVVFMFQLSMDIFNNHKLLNIWATLVNVYAGYALWQMARARIAGIVLAVVLAIATVCGGVIDLFPLHNDPMLAVPYQNDRLCQWLVANTKPSDVFLTHQVLTHPILFTGRKIYLGYTLFAWTAGYNVPDREALYRRMFQEPDRAELTRLLRENRIAYVAIDDGVRRNESLPELNEAVFREHFPIVFEDTTRAYDNLVIYQVP